MVTWLALVIMWTVVSSLDISCPTECECLVRQSLFIKAEVQTVNCSCRDLLEIPGAVPWTTESLLLRGNQFSELLVKIPILPHLLELDLSNNVIRQLGRGSIFQNLTELRFLDLSYNKFRTLLNGVFRGIRKLETLLVSTGHLKFIDEQVFDDMNKLKYLNLKENSIHSLSAEWFYDMMNLEFLEFSHNKMFYLNGGTFSAAISLRHLSLSHNRIRGIHENAFVGLRNLTTLLLNNNHITKVPSVALLSMRSLRVLRLDANPISQLGMGDFAKVPVEEISLSNSTSLQLIDRGSFLDLLSLKKTYLFNNPSLQYVDSQAFINVPQLRVLLLHRNNLSALSHEIVKRRPSIYLTLHGNPLLCNCNVRWVRRALDQGNSSTTVFLDPDKLTCSPPQNVSLISLKSLDLANIPTFCEPVMIGHFNKTINAEIRESQNLTCRALGIPTPKLHWILPSGIVLNESNNNFETPRKHPGTLILHHLKPKDSGVYKCVAENKVGVVIKNIILQVKNVDIGLFPQRVSSTFVTVVWNGTARNNFPEYDILYKTNDQPEEEYKSVTVSYVHRSYTINNLEPDTRYQFCIAIKDEEEGDYFQLSCVHAQTRDANFIMQGIYTTNKGPIAVVLGIVAGMSITVCMASMVTRRYRQKYYETPEKSLISNMGHAPPENLSSPLMLEDGT
ncbi:leucine-rich repeat neuronal protein 1-like [Tachypleus tridentatus]|uniref:leucine-rich repeat neuronal protein 1-like n=1 Tax=Tachypleus tridentatus TaxID=6853 RepID=UPI003FCFF0B9